MLMVHAGKKAWDENVYLKPVNKALFIVMSFLFSHSFLEKCDPL